MGKMAELDAFYGNEFVARERQYVEFLRYACLYLYNRTAVEIYCATYGVDEDAIYRDSYFEEKTRMISERPVAWLLDLDTENLRRFTFALMVYMKEQLAYKGGMK